MSDNPHANGGRVEVPLDLPAFTDYSLEVQKPGTERHESTRQLGQFLRDIFKRNTKLANFRLFCPDETNSNRLGAVFETTNRCFVSRLIEIDDHVSHDGRVKYATGNVLVVSHKATIRIILCELLGIDLGRYRDRIEPHA